MKEKASVPGESFPGAHHCAQALKGVVPLGSAWFSTSRSGFSRLLILTENHVAPVSRWYENSSIPAPSSASLLSAPISSSPLSFCACVPSEYYSSTSIPPSEIPMCCLRCQTGNKPKTKYIHEIF